MRTFYFILLFVCIWVWFINGICFSSQFITWWPLTKGQCCYSLNNLLIKSPNDWLFQTPWHLRSIIIIIYIYISWWRHQMEPVTRSFDVFFDLRPNKRLSEQRWGWWFETPSSPLWRQCNVILSPFQVGHSNMWTWRFTRLVSRYSFNETSPINQHIGGDQWRPFAPITWRQIIFMAF